MVLFMKQLGGLIFGLLALSACGSSSGGSFNGTVAGYSLHVVESVFTPLPETEDNPAFTLIVLSDRPGICNGIRSGTWGKNTTSFGIYLISGRPSVSPASPGTYHLVTDQPNSGVAYFLKQDDQCRAAPGLSDNSVPATSGSVVLESIDASPGKRARGSYDIILRSGEHVTGTFDAAYCQPRSSSVSTTCG